MSSAVPSSSQVRLNASLHRSDPWEYSQRFDYIHTRATAGCWASFEKQVAEQALATLEPGGWFESQEMDSVVACDDGTLDPNGPMIRWFQELTMAGEGCDRSFVLGATLKDVYERVGFVDVQQRIFKIPINGWAKDERFKELGRMWEKNIATGLSGFSLRMFNRAYGRSPAEIEVSMDGEYAALPSKSHCIVSLTDKFCRCPLSMCDKRFPTRKYTPICRYTSFGGGSRLQEKARSPHPAFDTQDESSINHVDEEEEGGGRMWSLGVLGGTKIRVGLRLAKVGLVAQKRRLHL